MEGLLNIMKALIMIHYITLLCVETLEETDEMDNFSRKVKNTKTHK